MVDKVAGVMTKRPGWNGFTSIINWFINYVNLAECAKHFVVNEKLKVNNCA